MLQNMGGEKVGVKKGYELLIRLSSFSLDFFACL